MILKGHPFLHNHSDVIPKSLDHYMYFRHFSSQLLTLFFPLKIFLLKITTTQRKVPRSSFSHGSSPCLEISTFSTDKLSHEGCSFAQSLLVLLKQQQCHRKLSKLHWVKNFSKVKLLKQIFVQNIKNPDQLTYSLACPVISGGINH